MTHVHFAVVTCMTLGRVALTILACSLLLADNILYALLVFGGAAVSDFDGWYARKYGVTTKFGAFLDPLADKLLVLSVIGCLLFGWWLPMGDDAFLRLLLLPTGVIVVREGTLLVIPLVRMVRLPWSRVTRADWFRFGHVASGTRPPSSFVGRVKMGIQCTALAILISALPQPPSEPAWIAWFAAALPWCGILAYWVAAYLTLISGLDYWRIEYPHLRPRINPILKLLWLPAQLRK